MTNGDGVGSTAVVVLALSVLSGGCFAEERSGGAKALRPSAPTSPDVQAVKALVADWVRLYNAGAYDALVSAFYAEDAVLMAPNAPPRNGRDAILHSFLADAELNDEHCDASTVDGIRVSGDLAVAWGSDTGTTTPRRKGTPVSYSLKWAMVFERQSGATWRCICEIWNENAPPAAETQSRERNRQPSR